MVFGCFMTTNLSKVHFSQIYFPFDTHSLHIFLGLKVCQWKYVASYHYQVLGLLFSAATIGAQFAIRRKNKYI